MIIKNGFVLLFDLGGFVKKDIRIEENKIAEIADNIEGNDIFDATGMYITPGMIDAHSHICISEEGKGEVGDDCNDYSLPLMPYLEPIDGINPYDSAVRTSVLSGVTAACVCPGSDSVIGGICTTLKLDGDIAEEMIIKRKTAMKCSFGENPKRAGYSFKSRMGTAYMLRKCLEDAKDYKYRKKVAQEKGEYFKTDIGMENMLLVLNREIPIHAHAHRADDICTAIRIANEYNLKLVIIHATDGVKIKDYISKLGYPVVLGPSMYPRTKVESQERCFETAGILSKAGVKICITADHDVTPLYYLSVYAAMSVRAGLDQIEGFKAVTKNPAEILGINDCKGEIKIGMDADIVVWRKHPFDYDTKVEKVYLEGKDMNKLLMK